MNSQIVNALRELGVPANIHGYEYLKSAIEICLSDKTAIDHVTKMIYQALANSFGTTQSGVERAIRHAIEISWDRCNIDTAMNYFGYTVDSQRGKPTNSEYIATVTEQLRLQTEIEVVSA
jgi:two-component system response regulator (stage 0 sporulation protein A)